MELHRQRCQKCQSIKMVNLLVRRAGKNDKIYVQCDQCKELVARYVTAPKGYYHHLKGFESYFRGINRGGHYESAKEITHEFDSVREEAVKEFAEALAKLEERDKKANKHS